MMRPDPLRPGDKVALLAPSGPVPSGRLPAIVQGIRDMGLEPEVYESLYGRHGYLAGSDELRAADLNRAFKDPEIRGVLCVRGGYGAQRILPLIDFENIRRNPKLFLGYSDITALHIAIGQICNLATFHAPMPGTWFELKDEYAIGELKRVLFTNAAGPLRNHPAQSLSHLGGGRARGLLTGGNLSLVASSLGTPWEIDTRGKILFLEEVGEEPYRVDGMMAHLRNAGKFKDCAGILLGAFTKAEAGDPERSLSLDQVFDELLPMDKPCIRNLSCGHVDYSLSLPMGREIAMDADALSLEIME